MYFSSHSTDAVTNVTSNTTPTISGARPSQSAPVASSAGRDFCGGGVMFLAQLPMTHGRSSQPVAW